MRPDFGCKIDDILFALDSSKTMSLAEHYKVLKDWWKTVERGNPEQKSVSIVFMDRDGVTEIQRRNLPNCVPCAWSMSDLGSGEQGVNQETISIVYENAEWGHKVSEETVGADKGRLSLSTLAVKYLFYIYYLQG